MRLYNMIWLGNIHIWSFNKTKVNAYYTAAWVPPTRSHWRFPQWPYSPDLKRNCRGIGTLRESASISIHTHAYMSMYIHVCIHTFMYDIYTFTCLPWQALLSNTMSSMAVSLLADAPLVASNTIWNSKEKYSCLFTVSDVQHHVVEYNSIRSYIREYIQYIFQLSAMHVFCDSHMFFQVLPDAGWNWTLELHCCSQPSDALVRHSVAGAMRPHCHI